MNSTSTKTKSRASIKHEVEQRDSGLTDLQFNKNIAGTILKASDPKEEWSGDFEPSTWPITSPVLNRLKYKDIHPVELTSYCLDLRTGVEMAMNIWEPMYTQEQKNRSTYRRASGKGWDKTDGIRELTVTYRPDLCMTLHLLGNRQETTNWMAGNVSRVGELLNQQLKGPKCFWVVVHNEKSIPHLHPKVITVNNEGELLWPRGESGKVPQGKKGLNLLGPDKLAIMRLVRAGIIQDDECAEVAFNCRCRATETKTANGMPLDWTLTCYLDDVTEMYIKSQGPKAIEMLKVVTADYKRYLADKMAGSRWNLKAQMKRLEAENDDLKSKYVSLEAKFEKLMALVERGVPAAPVAPKPVVPNIIPDEVANDGIGVKGLLRLAMDAAPNREIAQKILAVNHGARDVAIKQAAIAEQHPSVPLPNRNWVEVAAEATVEELARHVPASVVEEVKRQAEADPAGYELVYGYIKPTADAKKATTEAKPAAAPVFVPAPVIEAPRAKEEEELEVSDPFALAMAEIEAKAKRPAVELDI